MSSFTAEKILELVQTAHQAVDSRGEVLVVLRTSVEASIIRKLLADSLVAGVILPTENEHEPFRDDPEVGFAFGPYLTEFRYPAHLRKPALAALLIGMKGPTGFRIPLSLSRHGICLYVIAESVVGPVAIASTTTVLCASFIGRSTILCASFIGRLESALRRIRNFLLRTALCSIHRVVSFPAHLIHRSETIGRIYDEFLFTIRARRLLKRAHRVATEAEPSTQTVLLVIGSLGSGGAERQCVNTALVLQRNGPLRPVVVCARLRNPGGSFYLSLLEEAKIEVVDLYDEGLILATAPRWTKLLSVCRTYGDKLGYDIPEDLFRYLLIFLRLRPLVVHAFLDENNVKAGLAALLTKVPKIVLSARSVAPDNFELLRGYMRPGYDILLKHQEIVFCNNSRAGAADYRRWLQKPSLNIDVVHNGIDFQDFAVGSDPVSKLRGEFGIPKSALLVITVMRMSEEKQPLLWVRIAVELSRRRPDVHFAIIGDGPLRDQFRQIVVNARIESRVHMLGPRRDVSNILKAADLFLLTSRVEGLPNTLIEAQAVGVPVVTTPAGGSAETLDPGRTGLVSPDYSIVGLANTCMKLLDDDNLRARMAKAAPEFIRQHFSLESMYLETLRLYKC